jgi:RNA polymerase sigma factor (sigma-70 family)
MHIDPTDLRFATIVIASAVRDLGLRGSIPRSEREDVAAELMARLLTKWERYDPKRSPREAFIHCVVRSEVVSLMRKRRARKRHGIRVSLTTVETTLVDPDSERDGALFDLSLKIDLGEVTRLLTPRERVLADNLARKALKPLAEQMGVPRRTLRDEVNSIRELFFDAGLREYL